MTDVARTAKEPKHYRLKQHLSAFADSMPPGTAVPTERALAVDFETSRTTVRQAITELVVEGRLERAHGKGTFVAFPKLVQPLRLTSYTEDMQAQGFRPASRTLRLETVKAGPIVAEKLGIAAGAKMLVLERLRLSDDEPMGLETTHLDAARFPGFRRALDKHGSLYSALQSEYGAEPGSAEQSIETAFATPEEAALLTTDPTLPALLMFRHTWDTEGRPLEWVRSVYRGDRYKLVAHLSRPQVRP
ncbi:MAG TPA: GntR family transcriptional regulator [Candidatus Nanopelagicales bacterium]|jgi:GntR family transcriptional regulator|nr:GntR family transcriptional regulator [Candidatus Nanopelagicales bacterium]